MLPIYTIGHSTRTITEFVEVLQAGSVELVIDVRSVPRSRTNPQYNLDILPGALADRQIAHTHIAQLGGLRKTSKTIPPEVNGYWINRSFHNYADYALSDDFRRGMALLQSLASERRSVIMCAEAVWWRCHRRIIADYLLMDGWEVFHLMSKTHLEPATLTAAAKMDGGKLIYPRS